MEENNKFQFSTLKPVDRNSWNVRSFIKKTIQDNTYLSIDQIAKDCNISRMKLDFAYFNLNKNCLACTERLSEVEFYRMCEYIKSNIKPDES